jgi:hypothetical protein
VLANAFWHSTAFHGRASMRGRLRRREAVLRETPAPPLSRKLPRASARAMAAALETSPRSGAARFPASLVKYSG